MKIGVFAVLFGEKPFEETLDYLVEQGVEAVEIGTGAYPGNAHCNPATLLASDQKLKSFREAISRRGLLISALSCHGNPLHPDKRIARTHHETFLQTVTLARRLDVKTVITFSGCPGGDAKATSPNWITAPWPPEFAAMLDWQWKERVTPYWKETAKACRSAGVRVAIEMHPNFVAYNPDTMKRLSAIAPGVIGCNFDPSHMFWQGIDPVAAIRALGDSIYHVHAKDCRIDSANTSVNGVLDAKAYTRARALLDLPHVGAADALVGRTSSRRCASS
jgi:sugar phosphate isomerase/epimerase